MTPSIYQEVGVRLRELRLAAGLSQQELGDSLTPNRTQGGIAQLEQGSRKIDLETIHQLAGIFKVSPEFLLEGGWRPGKASGTNVVVIDGLDLQQAFDQYLLETPFIKLRNTEEVRLKALADPEACAAAMAKFAANERVYYTYAPTPSQWNRLATKTARRGGPYRSIDDVIQALEAVREADTLTKAKRKK